MYFCIFLCHLSALPVCPVMSYLSCLIPSVSHVISVFSALFCHVLSCQSVCPVRQSVFSVPSLCSVLSCLSCPVFSVLSYSGPLYDEVCLSVCMYVLSRQSYQSCMSYLPCPVCVVNLSCRACPVCESCHARPVSCFLLSCLSACKLCSVLSVLSCHMSLSCQQCPVCSALPYAVNPVLSLGSYLPCDVAPILSCLLGNALLVLFCTVLSGPVRSSLSCLFGSVHHVMSICLSYISSLSACLRSLCGLRLLHLPRFLSDLLTYSSFFFFSDTKPNAVVDFS